MNGVLSKELSKKKDRILEKIYFTKRHIEENKIEVEITDDIEGIADNVFIGFENLKTLILSNNNIESNKIAKNAFKFLKSLVNLDLSNNRIVEINGDNFDTLKMLEKIEYGSNNISMIRDSVFIKLSNLTIIDLVDNKIQKITKKTFNSLIKLQYLFLSNNLIEQIEQDSFLTLANLLHISLDKNKLSKIDKFLFRGLFNLQEILLDHNEFKFDENNKFELYLEYNVQRVTLANCKYGAQNDLNLIKNLVINI